MHFFQKSSKLLPPGYNLCDGEEVGKDSNQRESEERLLPKVAGLTPSHKETCLSARKTVAAAVLIVLWGALTLGAGIAVGRQWEGPWGTFENGFVEERVITPSNVFELVQTTFTGGVNFTPEGEEVLGPSVYVGEPGPEIDEAWNAIIGGESHYFSISEAEAKQLWGPSYEKYRDRGHGGWTGTLDLFHCLHCLVC
ncbi:hypothetical protein ZTR_09659 [Talaromyces verruculosus]|nr:hypothetical protein ZTR_09659 [Talaromyces verruculosus]